MSLKNENEFPPSPSLPKPSNIATDTEQSQQNPSPPMLTPENDENETEQKIQNSDSASKNNVSGIKINNITIEQEEKELEYVTPGGEEIEENNENEVKEEGRNRKILTNLSPVIKKPNSLNTGLNREKKKN